MDLLVIEFHFTAETASDHRDLPSEPIYLFRTCLKYFNFNIIFYLISQVPPSPVCSACPAQHPFLSVFNSLLPNTALCQMNPICTPTSDLLSAT
jgi:hypothetical protein